MTFLGYPRPDGTYGVRNHVLIIPASMCATSVCQRIAAQAPGTVALNSQAGCSQSGPDLEQTFRTLAGFGKNSNVAATLVVGLGCEALPANRLFEEISKSGKPTEKLVIQEQGGTRATIDAGIEIARSMAAEAAKIIPVEADLEHLMLGLECGGSDATSGLAANPVLGMVTDRLVQAGGTVILSEVTECIGAESILASRAVSPDVARQVTEMVGRCEQRLKAVGVDFVGSQPTPGNIAGGLSTIEEKSLGCVYKAGSAPLQGVLEYSERPQRRGLYLMDTPGNDPESITAEVAGGCQVVIFTTGRGTAVGSPIAPVIKVTGNSRTYAIMGDDIDVNTGTVIEGTETIEEAAGRTWRYLMEVVRGKSVKAEEQGFQEFIINRIGPSY